MVALAKPLDSKDITAALDFAERVRKLRPQAKQQADAVRVAAFNLRADIKRIATFPADISVAEFAELRGKMAALLGAAADYLDNSAAVLDAIAAMDFPAVERPNHNT